MNLLEFEFVYVCVCVIMVQKMMIARGTEEKKERTKERKKRRFDELNECANPTITGGCQYSSGVSANNTKLVPCHGCACAGESYYSTPFQPPWMDGLNWNLLGNEKKKKKK